MHASSDMSQHLPFVTIDVDFLAWQIIFAVVIACTLIYSRTCCIATEIDHCSGWTNTAGRTVFVTIDGTSEVLSMILTCCWTGCGAFGVSFIVQTDFGTSIRFSPTNMNVIVFTITCDRFETRADRCVLSFGTIFRCCTVITEASVVHHRIVQNTVAHFERIVRIANRLTCCFGCGE